MSDKQMQAAIIIKGIIERKLIDQGLTMQHITDTEVGEIIAESLKCIRRMKAQGATDQHTITIMTSFIDNRCSIIRYLCAIRRDE